MSDLRTLVRGRGGPHVRCVQGRLSLLSEGEQEEAAGSIETATATRAALAAGPLPHVHPLAYRGVVAGWPVPWRERWGRRANELEEAGLSWRDAEAQAFVEVWNTFRQGHGTHAMASSRSERN